MPAAAPIPSLLYYADSYDLVKEVATRLRLITGPRDPLPKGLWEKSRAIRRHAREAAEEEKRTERHRASFEGLMHDPAQEWARASTSFRPGSLAGFFAGAGADLPPFLAAWRDGEAAWPFVGAPFPRDFLHSTHPLLRLRALLPDWPEPGYGRDRVHLDAEEQAAAGLLLARADRYDLLEQAVAAGGRALLAPVRPAFEASLRERSVRALRTALAAERRRRDRLFRRFAAEDDPEPDERWIAIDWDAVRRAADAEGPLLREQAPEIAAHPACPMDLRVLVATRGADQFVWSRLLSDRPTGLHLLRTLPMRPDRSLAVPLSYAGETGVGVGDLLDLAHPADLLLRDAAGLPGIVRWHPMKCVITEDDERGPRRLARGITEAADRRLGDDPGAWTIGCRLVAGSRFTGSVNDLFARATAYRPRPRTGRDDDRVPMTGGA